MAVCHVRTIMEKGFAPFSLEWNQFEKSISIKGNAPFANEPIAVFLVH